MGQKTSATSLFRHPIGARAATAFLSGSAASDSLASQEP
ncbi:MAG: UDP-2,3-diacylglucosamine diphosphatase, partial [Burkholderia sp.]|nr:UDP-2,3-diacylglucosamine diphosphatase [Burkholderia sp.]